MRSKTILIRLSQEERRILEETARKLDLSMSATIRLLLRREHTRQQLERSHQHPWSKKDQEKR